MTKRVETFLEFAESQGVSADGLKAAEKAGLLDICRAEGRKLVLTEEVPDEAIDFARDFDSEDDADDDVDDGHDPVENVDDDYGEDYDDDDE